MHRPLWYAFLALWAVSLLWYGAVSPPAVAALAAGTALLWIASAFLLPEPLRLSRPTLALLAAASALAALQLLPLPPGLFPYTDALRARHGVAGSAPGTGDLFLTVRQLAQVGAYVTAGMFVKRLVDAGLRRMEMAAGVLAVLGVEAVYAVLQVGFSFRTIPFYGERPYGDSASGTLVNRNNFAGLLAIALVLAVAGAWARFSSPRRPRQAWGIEGGLPWALGAALFAACLVMTKSRGGTLAAAAGLVLLPFILRRSRAAASAAGFALLAVLGVVAVAASNTEPLVQRFESLDAADVASDSRVECWSAALAGWKQQPMLGFGIGTFPETFRPFQPAGLPGQFQHAHNEYVNALFEGGIAGLAVLAAGFALWLARALRGLRRLEGSERAAAAACIAAALAIAVHSLVDFDLRITSVGLLFSVALAAALPAQPGAPPPTPKLLTPHHSILTTLPSVATLAAAAALAFADLPPVPSALAASAREPAHAEPRLASILRLSPFDAIAASLQAHQAERRGDLPLAATRLETAASLWPANPDFQRDAALWFLDHADHPRATPCLRRFFQQSPSAVESTLAPLWSASDPVTPWEPALPTPRATARFASFLARKNLWQDAADVFRRGVPPDPANVREYDDLAGAFHHAGQWGLEASLREDRLRVRSDPDAHAAAAAAWARLEAWDDALRHALIAVRIDPGRADWQVTLADVLAAKGDGLGAIGAFTEAVRIRPDDDALRMRRAGEYRRQKLYALAAEDYRVVTKSEPKNREAVMGLVEALAGAGKLVEAIAAVEGWVDANPQDEGAKQVRERLRR